MPPVAGDNLFEKDFTEASHTKAEWQVLRRTSASAATPAQADTVANAGANKLILCTEDVDANTFAALMMRSVDVKLPSGHGLGGSYGDPIFLSHSSAGAMTLTAPTQAQGKWVYLGYVIDTTTIFWDPGRYALNPDEAPEV